MRAGRLDRRVTIQRPATVTGEYGQEQTAWPDVATVWARVQPLPAGEAESDEVTLTRRRLKVTIRWLATLDMTHRLIWEDREWNIIDLAEIGRRFGWIITAEAVE